MGNVLSWHLNILSIFQRQSRAHLTPNSRTTEEGSVADDTDGSLMNKYFSGELVPERYLVLLTEQMTEMLFHLMACHETSIMMFAEGSTDHRMTVTHSVGINHVSTPMTMGTSSPNNGRSSLQVPSIHQSCVKCNMKMLTIEEFRELYNAFRRVDRDHDNFLTRDEIRTTLNYLFELTEYDIKEIISVFDTNKDDRISFEEYIEEMKHRLLHQFTREEIKVAFDQADVQQNGHLRVDELKSAIGYLNFHIPNRRIVEVVNECVKEEVAESIDFVLFTNVIKALHRREPITLQKFKPIHHIISTGTPLYE